MTQPHHKNRKDRRRILENMPRREITNIDDFKIRMSECHSDLDKIIEMMKKRNGSELS